MLINDALPWNIIDANLRVSSELFRAEPWAFPTPSTTLLVRRCSPPKFHVARAVSTTLLERRGGLEGTEAMVFVEKDTGAALDNVDAYLVLAHDAEEPALRKTSRGWGVAIGSRLIAEFYDSDTSEESARLFLSSMALRTSVMSMARLHPQDLPGVRNHVEQARL